MLDAGSDDLDAALRVAVQPAELAFLLGTADQDCVGAADDLAFGAVAPLGFEVAAFRLHSGERVKGADEGNVELMLQAMRDETAEEIVGVQHVGR